MNAFLEGCRLYTGEFLPNMIGEDWVTVRNIHYRDLYFSCLTELCEWLKEEERYEEIYQLTTTAAEIYPFEDWQIYRIDSLIAMAGIRKPMEAYEKTARLFLTSEPAAFAGDAEAFPVYERENFPVRRGD